MRARLRALLVLTLVSWSQALQVPYMGTVEHGEVRSRGARVCVQLVGQESWACVN